MNPYRVSTNVPTKEQTTIKKAFRIDREEQKAIAVFVIGISGSALAAAAYLTIGIPMALLGIAIIGTMFVFIELLVDLAVG